MRRRPETPGFFQRLSASSLLAPFDGHFEPTVTLGQHVERGQTIGFVHDFNHLDDAPAAMRAPHDGYVVCQAWRVTVFGGQVISQVGKVAPWPRPA